MSSEAPNATCALLPGNALQTANEVYTFSAHSNDDVLERYKRTITDEDLLNLSPEELCKDRRSEEYFRLTTEGDCRDVVRWVGFLI